MFDVPTPTLSELVNFLRAAQSSWAFTRSSRTGNIGSVVISVGPADWPRLIVEASIEGIDPYVDPIVDGEEFIFHMPVKDSWKSYVRVFVVRRTDFPPGLWVVDLDEAHPWPPDLLLHYEHELDEWEAFWAEQHAYNTTPLEAKDGIVEADEDWYEEPVEPIVPDLPLPAHVYRFAGPSELEWIERPLDGQIHLRRGRQLDHRVTRAWVDLVVNRISPRRQAGSSGRGWRGASKGRRIRTTTTRSS